MIAVASAADRQVAVSTDLKSMPGRAARPESTARLHHDDVGHRQKRGQTGQAARCGPSCHARKGGRSGPTSGNLPVLLRWAARRWRLARRASPPAKQSVFEPALIIAFRPPGVNVRPFEGALLAAKPLEARMQKQNMDENKPIAPHDLQGSAGSRLLSWNWRRSRRCRLGHRYGAGGSGCPGRCSQPRA